MATEVRKSVIIVDSSKDRQSEYKNAFGEAVILKQAFTVDDAMELIIKHFKEGVILVINATIENRLDGLRVINMAKVLAEGNRYVPVFIAIAINEEDDKIMRKAGCTIVKEKSDVVPLIQSYGVSKAPRENRGLDSR